VEYIYPSIAAASIVAILATLHRPIRDWIACAFGKSWFIAIRFILIVTAASFSLLGVFDRSASDSLSTTETYTFEVGSHWFVDSAGSRAALFGAENELM
jgi:hypothetical protein|tara:strand:- start:118 stop:414 length:297 start_codon:yes stop_codon:yes gene_type:complete